MHMALLSPLAFPGFGGVPDVALLRRLARRRLHVPRSLVGGAGQQQRRARREGGQREKGGEGVEARAPEGAPAAVHDAPPSA